MPCVLSKFAKYSLCNDSTNEALPWTKSPELDSVVRAVVSKRPFEVSPEDTVPSWDEAVEWAAAAWKTVYISLMARREQKTRAKHPIWASPAKEFINDLAVRYCEKKAIPWLKFHTTYLFAKHAKQDELPELPAVLAGSPGKPGILAGGWVYTRCRRILQGRPEDFGAACDILYSKYGMPKAPEDFIAKALADHRITFSKEPARKVLTIKVKCGETTKEIVQDHEETIDTIKNRIDDICALIFTRAYDGTFTVPKQSASFETPCSKGGQLRKLIEDFWQACSLEDMRKILKLSHTSPNLRRMKELKPGFVCDEFEDLLAETICFAFVRLNSYRAAMQSDSRLKARQFGIAEPLKTRVILAAEAIEMFLVTSFQKYMHSAIRDFPPFHFTGAPDTCEELEACLGSLNEGEEFVSGDYSAATDNINPRLSESCWSSICKYGRMTIDEKALGMKCLTGHRVFKSKQLPDWKKDEGVDQQNGQSMGSPMSFPILCIVNLACWSLAYGFEAKDLFTAPVRVNGDDIVFKGKKEVYAPWWELNGVAGLYPSKGKNYRSQDFININSHTYSYRTGHLERVAVVNLAIVQNMVRKGLDAGKQSKAPWFTQKSNYDSLVSGHTERVQKNLREIFLEHVRVPDFLAIDLPVRCGGPGFNVGTHFSVLARKQASLFMTSKDQDRFLIKKPVLSDDSSIGKKMRQWKSTRSKSWHSRVVKEENFARHEGNMSSGDVFGQLVMTEHEAGDEVTKSTEILSGWDLKCFCQLDAAYKNPKFLTQQMRYEERLKRFYDPIRLDRAFYARDSTYEEQVILGLSKGWVRDPGLPEEVSDSFAYEFTLCKEDSPEGPLIRPDWKGLHLADYSTCVILNQNWAVETLTWNSANVHIDYRRAFSAGISDAFYDTVISDLADDDYLDMVELDQDIEKVDTDSLEESVAYAALLGLGDDFYEHYLLERLSEQVDDFPEENEFPELWSE